MIEEASNAFFIFGSFIFFKGVIFCLGIIVFDLYEKERVDKPNNPVSKGRRGSLTGRFKFKKPRIPESKKIIRGSKILFSLNIEYEAKNIRINGINVFNLI